MTVFIGNDSSVNGMIYFFAAKTLEGFIESFSY